MKRYLLSVIGFTQVDLDVLQHKIAEKGYADRVRLIAQPYPAKKSSEQISFKQKDLSFASNATYDALFGEQGRTRFCNNDQKTCALKFGRGKKTCLNHDPSRCRDSRPDVILLVYLARSNYKIGGRLGRYALPVKCPVELFGKSIQLASYCIEQVELIESNQYWVLFDKLDTRNYLLLPHRNFKNHKRSENVNGIQSVGDFFKYSLFLKKELQRRGGKIVDERNFEFKRDKPHRFPSSNVSRVDWLNAHYRYGFRFDFRHHYDVTSKDDGLVENAKMLDIINDSDKVYSSDHLNIFPNDEVQI